MRDVRKIIFVILALLPLMALLVYAVGNVGNDTGIEMPLFGSISVENDDTGVTVSYPVDGLCASVGGSILPAGSYTGASASLLSVVPLLASYGIPVDSPACILGVLYLVYLTILEFVELLFDFITWIPRKARELMR